MSWFYVLLFIQLLHSGWTIESRVFGGDDLRFEVHKYLVKLKIFHLRNTGMCSGSILDKNWIITSAHCFKGREKYVAVYHQFKEGSKIIAKVDPSNIFTHPDWGVENFTLRDRAFDLALLKTTPIKFSDYIQPIKLSKNLPRSGQSAIIAGFGESEGDTEPPREGFVSIDWCNFGVPGLLCSEATVRAGSGDSGGSLTSHGKLIGVTSASCRNAEEPKECVTVYVSVVANLKWIREILLQ